jgi:hypothetical protein
MSLLVRSDVHLRRYKRWLFARFLAVSAVLPIADHQTPFDLGKVWIR